MLRREGSWKLIGVRPSSGRRIIASETSVNFSVMIVVISEVIATDHFLAILFSFIGNTG
jgi:hypothetical protein